MERACGAILKSLAAAFRPSFSNRAAGAFPYLNSKRSKKVFPQLAVADAEGGVSFIGHVVKIAV
ncbi:MAG TPA: hypothetical protein H9945_06220, partial [Candidatus Gemmiger avicola]|nr:hypothetical protein [Candidatus Gemmiger avicola]